MTVNNIPDISLTCSKFPDISRFSRQEVTLFNTEFFNRRTLACSREQNTDIDLRYAGES